MMNKEDVRDFCKYYEIDYKKIISFIEENKPKKTLLQAPDGLKKLLVCVYEEINGLTTVIFSSSPSYGACDLPVEEIEKLCVNALIHIGHNKYPLLRYDVGIPVLYIEAYYRWNIPDKLVDDIARYLRERHYERIGLLASIQHVKSLIELKNKLEEKGFRAVIGKTSYPHVMLDGQVLGCEYSSALNIMRDVDVFLVVSGGIFHSLGLALISVKEVLAVDPYRNTVWNATGFSRKYLSKRYYIVSKLRYTGIRSIGIIVGSRPGQYRPRIIEFLKQKAEEKGYSVYIISSTVLDKERLIAIDNALNLDVYVVTSCPRLPIDDLSDFYKPVITPGEFIMLVEGLKKYVYPW